MSMDEKLLLRNKILGIIMRDARNAGDKTQEECASFLGMSASRLSDIEHGEQPISLPELESLAFFLGLPVDHFFNNQLLEQDQTEPTVALDELLSLRHRIVGALLRQARLAANRTQQECAELVGVSDSTISAYEYGQSPISLAELEALSDFLDVPLDTFLDQEHNPLSKTVSKSEAAPSSEDAIGLSHFSPEIQEFLKEPLNADYVQTALSLSKMPTDQLCNIAETLLEITY